MRKLNWVLCVFAFALGGCSLYPIPDDVSPYRTEQIVRYARCEVKFAILGHMIQHHMLTEPYTTADVKSLIDTTRKKAKNHPKELTDTDNQVLRLTKVAMVYSFDFNITENNKASAGAGFRLPSLTNTLDVGGTAGLDLTRVGSRVFGTQDSWDDLVVKDQLCANWPGPRPANVLYPMTGSMGFDPLTGSIGVGRVVETFIDIDLQGGAKDNFVDTLTFTTSVSADANATIKLDPVPSQFRLVSATADAGASRIDVHKLTISLAFPQADPPPAGGISGVARVDGDLNAPFERPAPWRARYNLCVQDARTREAAFRQLRLTDPVVYCIAYADEFAPKYGRAGETQPVVTTTTTPRTSGAPGGSKDFVAPDKSATTTTPRVRPNLRPMFQ